MLKARPQYDEQTKMLCDKNRIAFFHSHFQKQFRDVLTIMVDKIITTEYNLIVSDNKYAANAEGG